MGLIKVVSGAVDVVDVALGVTEGVLGAVSGTLADQWKEFFYCEAMPSHILVAKGIKKTSERSANRKGETNVISNGSHLIVADGQCALIVEDGIVMEVCAESGLYRYNSQLTPTVFEGNGLSGIREFVKESLGRMKFGGGVGKDQRIYYINLKEISGNRYGTVTPIPFRIVDRNIGLDMDVSVRCHGEYSYRIVNPVLFYQKVCGNVEEDYMREELEHIMKAELLTAMQPAFAKISEKEIRYNELPRYSEQLTKILSEELSEKWEQMRGIRIFSFGFHSLFISEEDEEQLKELQRMAVMRNPDMAAANLVQAQAEAMKLAASNESGAMLGLAGMEMARQVGGTDVQSLYQIGRENNERKSTVREEEMEGQPVEWICEVCGARNRGKFCMECGTKKTVGISKYRCNYCGWIVEKSEKIPKFCPECGKPFNMNN